MGGKAWRFLIGGAVGAGLQYLSDPVSGRSRRARLADQARARGREARDNAGRQLRYQAGQAKGVLHEFAPEPDDRPTDDATVLQRIRSEILGPLGIAADVRVEDGAVMIAGKDGDNQEELVEKIRRVPGVQSVTTARGKGESG